MIVVDTSVWIDYLHDAPFPQVERLDALLDTDRIVVPDLVLCEVLRGVRDDRQAANVESLMRRGLVVRGTSDMVAVRAAAGYRALRRAGITVRSTIDLLIGTFCIMEGHALLHRDQDYCPMEQHLGLRVVHA